MYVCMYSTNVTILLILFNWAIIALKKLINSQHYTETYQKKSNDRINQLIKSIFLKSFKFIQNDLGNGRIVSHSFKRDQKISYF